MSISLITLAIAFHTYGRYQERTAARRAALTFARDLSLARSSATRARVTVVVRFDEVAREYTVTTGSGRELIRRSYDDDSDVRLGSIDLGVPGDSLVFDARGRADLSGITGSLGEAAFTAATASFTVSFNALGASRVRES